VPRDIYTPAMKRIHRAAKWYITKRLAINANLFEARVGSGPIFERAHKERRDLIRALTAMWLLVHQEHKRREIAKARGLAICKYCGSIIEAEGCPYCEAIPYPTRVQA